MGNRAHVLEGNGHLPTQRDGVIGLSLEVPIKIHPIVGIIVGCHDGKGHVPSILIHLDEVIDLLGPRRSKFAPRGGMIPMIHICMQKPGAPPGDGEEQGPSEAQAHEG